MVTERSIVWMFSDSHDLNNVISQLDNSWQDCLLEMCEAVNFVISSAHSNMDFVNLDVFIFPLGFGVFPFILSEIYMHSIEREVNILGSKVDPSWNPINNISISQFDFTLNL